MELKKVSLKVADIVKPDFQQSFLKLKKTPTISGPTSFKLARLGKLLTEASSNYIESRDEFYKQASIDETTKEPVISGFSPSGDPIYAVKNENVPNVMKKVKELGSVTIEVDEFKYSDLGYTEATPNDERKINAHDIEVLGFVVE